MIQNDSTRKRFTKFATTLAAFAIATFAGAQSTLQFSTSVNAPDNRDDHPLDLEVDVDGALFTCGVTVEGALWSNLQPLVSKVSESGAVLWTSYGHPAFGQGTNVSRIALSADAVYALGSSSITVFGTGHTQMRIWKIEKSTGVILWTRVYEAPWHTSLGSEINVDSQGNIVAVGTRWNDSGFFPGNNAVAHKYDANGNLLWRTVYEEPIATLSNGQGFHFVEFDSQDNLVVTGEKSVGSTRNPLVFKLNGESGEQIWQWDWQDLSRNFVQVLKVASNDDVILGVNSSVELNGQFRERIRLTKLDGATGNHKWSSVETMPFYSQFTGKEQVSLDPSDNVVATLMMDYDGNTTTPTRNNDNMRTFMFDADTGARMWMTEHGTTVRFDHQQPRTVRTDDFGNVLVAGVESLPTPTVTTHMMIRAMNPIGENIWYHQHTVANEQEVFRTLMDSTSRLVGAGENYSPFTGTNIRLFRYAPNTVVTLPNAYNVFAGTPFGGSLNSLLQNDFDRLTVLCDEFDPTGTVVIEGVAPSGTWNQIQAGVQASSEHSSASVKVELYNFQSASYETCAIRSVTSHDRLITGALGGNVSRFIESGTGKVRMRVNLLPSVDLSSVDGWMLNVDKAVWGFVP